MNFQHSVVHGHSALVSKLSELAAFGAQNISFGPSSIDLYTGTVTTWVIVWSDAVTISSSVPKFRNDHNLREMSYN